MIAYLIPEFPGQTHIWMWREIQELRRLGLGISILSTRAPRQEHRARHAFASEAAGSTAYLWPTGSGRLFRALAWCLLAHPIGSLRGLLRAWKLPQAGNVHRRAWRLFPPAAVLVWEAHRRGVKYLHLQSAANSCVLAMIAKQICGMRYSLTINADVHSWGGAMLDKMSDADFVVTHSRWVAGQIRSDFPSLPADRVVVAPVGVDTEAWRPEPQPPKPGCWTLVSVGRLHPQKGHKTVIDGLRLLIDAGRDARLRLVGGGDFLAELREHVAARGLNDRVDFLGSLPEDRVLEELHRASVFVLATESEALGVVFMEAMAAGIPVVGARVGGVGELIEDGVTGLLIEPRSPQAVAAAVERMMTDDALREDVVRRARAFICERYDRRLGARTLFERLTKAIGGERA